MSKNVHLAWLYSRYSTTASKLGLSRIEVLCARLGNPEKKLKKVVHIGGTNGKGSSARLISNILRCAGYSVGTYLSPHLHSYNERFLLDSVMVSNDELDKLLSLIKPVVEQLDAEGISPTFFEITTVVAFLLFEKKNLDFCIVEVGLGGRFDATNVVVPDVCVITNISLEHTQQLGTTTEKIAFEKAGIIKSAVPIITAVSDEKALGVIREVAEQLSAPLEVVYPTDWNRLSASSDKQAFEIKNSSSYSVVASMLGLHQGENIALAIRTCEELRAQGVRISEKNIQDGVFQTKNPGRMEILCSNPMLLIDGAHNPGGIKALVNTLSNDLKYDKLVLVVGLLKDKNFEEILDLLLPICNICIATLPRTPRARSAEDLMCYAKKTNPCLEVLSSESVSEALDIAFKKASADDLICVTGSLFTVGEARFVLNSKMKCAISK